MPSPVSRIRERMVPPPKGSIQVGVRLTRAASDHRIVATLPIMATAGSYPLSVESTQDFKNPGPPYETGSTFRNFYSEGPCLSMQGTGNYKGAVGTPTAFTYYEYQGGHIDPSFTGLDTASVSDYANFGRVPLPAYLMMPADLADCGEVYARLKPRLQKVGLGVALAETRDLPQMITTSAQNFHLKWKALGGNTGAARMAPKTVADNFLNHVFGWAPFVKDMVDLYDTYQNSEKYIAALERNNNSWVKRRRTIRNDATSNLLATVGGSNWCIPGALPTLVTKRVVAGLGNVSGYAQYYEEFQTRRWAVGSFKFYKPEFDTNLVRNSEQERLHMIGRYLKLYGVQCSPSVIWKITPWSWLVDWFTNIGDLVDRVTDYFDDSMVTKYMYLMTHHTRRLTVKGEYFYTGGPVKMSWSRLFEVKTRLRAQNPYNFCLGWGDLSSRQLAILGALGISRRSF